jgi:surfeit locus 1 family protein
MIGRLPVTATIVVACAIGAMVALGIWQLARAEEKAALIAGYETASLEGKPVAFPAQGGGLADQADLFHPAAFDCARVIARSTTAGRDVHGRTGFAHIARCLTERGPAEVKLGWSRTPEPPKWEGGPVSGIVAPGGADGARLQLLRPVEGLEPLAPPDPADLPNNHLAYAIQWFLFAVTALVIYIVALRRRVRAPPR